MSRLLVGLLTVSALLVACGDDDADSSTSPSTVSDDAGDPATGAPDPAEATDDGATEDGAAEDGATTDDGSVPDHFDFTLADLRGGEVDGTSFVDSDVVVWFWAPWCTKCNQQAPAIAAIADERDDVTFLGMAGLDDRSSAEDFIARHGLDGFPHAFDEAGDTWQTFGITTQSSFAFIDDGGTVETESYVTLDGDALEERIDRLVAG